MSKYLTSALFLLVLFPEGGFNVDNVQVGSALSASLNGDQTDPAQFTNIRIDALAGGAHICRQPILAWEAFVHFTGVLEQHGIGQLGTNGDLFALQDEVGHTRPAMTSGNVRPFQAQVAVSKSFDIPQALHTHECLRC